MFRICNSVAVISRQLLDITVLFRFHLDLEIEVLNSTSSTSTNWISECLILWYLEFWRWSRLILIVLHQSWQWNLICENVLMKHSTNKFYILVIECGQLLGDQETSFESLMSFIHEIVTCSSITIFWLIMTLAHEQLELNISSHAKLLCVDIFARLTRASISLDFGRVRMPALMLYLRRNDNHKSFSWTICIPMSLLLFS